MAISIAVSARNTLFKSLNSEKIGEDTVRPHGDIFIIRPFTYKVDTFSMPDSLNGEHLYVTINLTAWVNSNSHLLSMHPISIIFYSIKFSPSLIILPIKARNYVPVVVYLK